MSEKRSYRRYPIWFPVTLVIGETEVWAICRDASSGGVLVSAAAPLEPGTTLAARFRVRPEVGAERSIPATVVRQEFNEDELLLAFPYRVALEFAAPVEELLDELTDHADVSQP